MKILLKFAPNYKDVWESSLKHKGGSASQPQFHASLPPRRAQPSPPISPLLTPSSSSLYDEFYPWRGEDPSDPYWEDVFLNDCLDEQEKQLDWFWREAFDEALEFTNKREVSEVSKVPSNKTPPCFNEDFEYLYVTDMRSTMGKHCALIFTDSVSWLSKKRCPKRCRVYVIPGVHLAINDLFKNKFEWIKIAVSEMWQTRQNNCKEICHRHKHNSNHIIRNLIISKSPLPKMN